MPSKQRKRIGLLNRAFTLTELLVVVIVLGVLSAVGVPKMTRVLETRKTTEAEDLMSAVRMEQEKRCSLGQNYAVDFKKIPAVASTLGGGASTSNYRYALTGSGIAAQSAKDYHLKMLSYKDGKICCEGTYCARLNKDYPPCSSFSLPVDECATRLECAGAGTQRCGCNQAGTQSRTCDTNTGSWSAWSACSVGACQSCAGPASQSCGCNNAGTQSRSCNSLTGEWSAWSACSVGACQSCAGPASQSCGCNNAGTQSRSCNSLTGEWSAWSACSVGACQSCAGSASQSCGCNNAGTQSRSCNSLTGEWSAWSACSIGACQACAGESIRSCGNCGQTQSRVCNKLTGTWDAWSPCPADPTCSGTSQQVCPVGQTGKRTRVCQCGTWSAWDDSGCRETCDSLSYLRTHKAECCPSAAKADTICWTAKRVIKVDKANVCSCRPCAMARFPLPEEPSCMDPDANPCHCVKQYYSSSSSLGSGGFIGGGAIGDKKGSCIVRDWQYCITEYEKNGW